MYIKLSVDEEREKKHLEKDDDEVLRGQKECKINSSKALD
mgnify:CR=1 FL=1